MRWSSVALVLLLAGCAGPTAPPPQVTTDPSVMVGDCGTLPDGTPLACHVQEFVPAESTGRPPLADGWRCTHTWGEDGVLVESYSKPDGALAFYWEWQRWKPDGLAFQRLGWYEGDGVGLSLHVPYQPTGFVSLPAQDPQGRVEIHHTFRQLRIHANIDGTWMQDPENASFIVNDHGGDTWWVARFDWPGGPYFVSTMHEDREEGQMGAWSGGAWRGTVAGTEVIIDATGNGIKYVGVDYSTRRATLSGCGLPSPI